MREYCKLRSLRDKLDSVSLYEDLDKVIFSCIYCMDEKIDIHMDYSFGYNLTLSRHIFAYESEFTELKEVFICKFTLLNLIIDN